MGRKCEGCGEDMGLPNFNHIKENYWYCSNCTRPKTLTENDKIKSLIFTVESLIVRVADLERYEK